MAKKEDTPEKSSSVFDEIEEQLSQTLAKRKEELERELEEKIRLQKEETQKKIEELNNELKQGKGALTEFQNKLDDFEKEKAELKAQIKGHIDKAVEFQTEIETKTGQTLEELKTVSTLNQKLETLQRETEEKLLSLKKDLEEKFGIVAEMPANDEHPETEINLDQELAKLKKIRELLNSNEIAEEVSQETVPQEPVEEKPEAQPKEEPKPEEETKEEAKAEVSEEEPAPVKEAEEEAAEEPEEKKEEPVSEEKPEPAREEEDASFQNAFEKLEEFRKGSTSENDAEVSYFEKDEKIVLDGEYLVSSLNNCFEEAKKLYIKLSQTESPKDQFFIKQEIIKLQEALRKVLLRSIRMCEKDNCSLPEFTSEVLSVDVLKNALEMVSMQNWSNQDDFASFDNFAKGLKDSFYTRITPPAAYLQSIMKELNIS